MRVLIKSRIFNHSTKEENTQEAKALMNNNIITYMDGDSKTSIDLNTEFITLNRVIENGNIFIDFNQDAPVCKLDMKDNYLNLNIEIIKYIRYDKNVSLEYKVEEDIIEFDFSYEEI